MKKYVEIIEDSSKRVSRRFEVTGQSERQIGKLKDGISINLNHAEYSVLETESEKELPTGDIK